MKIEEKTENGIITIDFIIHKVIAQREFITIGGKSSDEIFNEKLLIIKKLTNPQGIYLKFSGKGKEILKAWGLVDDRFTALYKKLYPVGGWRNGGRPKGSRTEKTTMLKVRITPAEEKFLLEQLEKYRKKSKKI